MDLLLIIIFGVFGLSFIIFIHELGHFIAAKISGVGVETFSIGFGKKLVGFTRKGTTYQLSMILLGGYCKLKGEMFKPDFTEEDFQQAKEEEGSFMAASTPRKIFIVIAGPLANILCAILLFSFISMAGTDIHTTIPKIVLFSEYPAGTETPVMAAASAGLKTGDVVSEIDNKKVGTYADIQRIVLAGEGRTMTFEVTREGSDAVLFIPVTPETNEESGRPMIGIWGWYDPVIGFLRHGGPAAGAGLKSGDRIISVNGTTIPHGAALRTLLSGRPETLAVAYERDGEVFNTAVTPEYNEAIQPESASFFIAALGIDFKGVVIHTPPVDPATAFVQGVGKTVYVFSVIVKAVETIATKGVRNITDLFAGPVRITETIGQQAVSGFSVGIGDGIKSFLEFICAISILLGLMNLLPIPVVDGGQVVLAVIMRIKKKLTSRFVYRYQYVGIVIIVLLTILAFSSDFLYYFRV
ncbi:MAG: RIP metalloprotease RseP [Spirochaetales bacterium]|nr:RIP metalloprotease RseP [Spirochaetales bacterium]